MSQIQDNVSDVKVLPRKRGECAEKSNMLLFALLIKPKNSADAAAAVMRNVCATCRKDAVWCWLHIENVGSEVIAEN